MEEKDREYCYQPRFVHDNTNLSARDFRLRASVPLLQFAASYAAARHLRRTPP